MMGKAKGRATSAGIFLLGISLVYAQGEHPPVARTDDLKHSVFGPPRPAIWEFQLSRMAEDDERVTTFNFYRKDQRNKTLFFKLSDNELNNRNELRVKEVTGGAVLFPLDDDDRYQGDIGGTYDRMKDTSLAEKTFYTRITVRPDPRLWLRAGYEVFDGFTPGGRTVPYNGLSSSAIYGAAKGTLELFSLMAVVGQGREDGAARLRYGAGGIVELPWNTFALAGYIASEDRAENVRTLAIGRWAPFRPDGLPGAVVVWKHRDRYDFQLGGIFYGGNNVFVRPAAIGMTQGMFISSMALRENSELRQGQLMSITDYYRNADFTFFYVYMQQGIEMIPGRINHVGFRAVQVFKLFSGTQALFFSKPVIGAFYNEETEPVFVVPQRTFVDERSTYWSFQLGATVQDVFIVNTIVAPDRTQWRVALSYVYQ